MSNSYFNHENPLNRHTLGRAEQVNSIFQAIEDGFDKLPDPEVVAQGRITYVVDKGLPNSYVVDLYQNPDVYVEGLAFVMRAANTNTGPSVINVNGMGVKQIRRFDGSQLLADDITAGMLVQLGYDGQYFRLIGQHGSEVSGAKHYAEQSAISAAEALASENEARSLLETFHGTYYGPLPADPALDPNGNPPTEGDWYFNTTSKVARQFDGSSWGDMGKASMRAFTFTAQGGETSLSGHDDNGNILTYTPGLLKVYKNGVRLTDGVDYTATDGSTIADLDALQASDVITLDAFSAFAVSDTNVVTLEDLGSTDPSKGAALVGFKHGNVQEVLEEHSDKLSNVEGNLNFTTLPSAITPVGDDDLFLIRQGAENKKVSLGAVKAELAAEVNEAKDAAENSANRAEAARDAAFINADVYEDIESGLAAVADGEQFQVVEGLNITRYVNDNGTAKRVTQYPSSLLVDRNFSTAMKQASEPSRPGGEFFVDDWGHYQSLAVVDSEGKQLVSWSLSGNMDFSPSEALKVKIRGHYGDFFTKPATVQPALSIVGNNGGSAFSVYDNGSWAYPWISEFYTSPSDVGYAWVDKETQRAFHRLDKDGNSFSDFSNLPTGHFNQPPKTAYNQQGYVRVTPSGNSFLGVSPGDIFTEASDIYSLYDELETEFSDYITKEVLGVDGEGNEILQYTAVPAGYHTRWFDTHAPQVLAKPKVVLFGGTHGGERGAVITNYQFLRELCLRWKEDERLGYLRWGMELVLIPLVTPSGFNNGTHLNYRGININRNFPYGWSAADGDKGESPASEIETQIVMDVIDDNLDACVFIDHHNAGSLTTGSERYAYWIGTERPETIEIARASCDHMMQYLRREFPHVDQSNSKITRLVDSYNGTLSKYVQKELNKNGFTLETGTGLGSHLARESHAMEALVNLVYMCVKRESRRRETETVF